MSAKQMILQDHLPTLHHEYINKVAKVNVRLAMRKSLMNQSSDHQFLVAYNVKYGINVNMSSDQDWLDTHKKIINALFSTILSHLKTL